MGEISVDSQTLDTLVRAAVRKLGDEPISAKQFLLNVGPEKSARYLVGALVDQVRRPSSMIIKAINKSSRVPPA